jgi:hypothetical protein
MFEQVDIALDRAALQLSAGKISRLHEAAAKMRKSSNGWGIYNQMAESEGLNPASVIGLSNNIVRLKKILTELDASVTELSADGINGCANNWHVDEAIKEKFGGDHCDESQSVFCKGVRVLAGEDTDMTPTLAIGVQREMIRRELLKEGEDDGDFGSRSIKAFETAMESPDFVEKMKKCGIR